MSRLLTLLAASLLSTAAGAQQVTINTYTESQSGTTQIALGYPVPLPIASLTPVAGFRDYASLHARLQSLALASSDIDGHVVGQTHAGRDIWAYVLASQPDLDVEGRARAAFFINATTHAREWASPEVATGLVERMAAGADDGHLVRWLLDNTRLVIIPVHNVDGFNQTQRYPDQVIIGADPGQPNLWPRDGRMRRKNMRGVDEVLTTFGDHLLGIDLNRNHPPFWATSPNGSSTNPNSLTFHGSGPHSEPESAALVAAAEFGPASRMRLGVDMHTFSRVFFSSNTGLTRLNAIQSQLLALLTLHHFEQPVAGGQQNGVVYQNVPDPANKGMGVAAEYFAYEWLVPAMTLELEPRNGASDYGGNGVSHDGFILPENQIARVREAWAETYLVGFYFMAGPAHLARVRLFDAGSGSLLREQRWRWDAVVGQRVAEVFADGDIVAGQRLRAELSFSKPMRRRVNGIASAFPGIFAPNPAVSRIEGEQEVALDSSAGEWIATPGLRYADDTFAFEFDALGGDQLALAVQAYDMAGQVIDAVPATPVDWNNGAWSGLETTGGSEGDVGGTDRSTTFALVEDSSPVTVAGAPQAVGEGDRFDLQLQLDTPAEQPVTLQLAASATAFDAAPVSWAAGESGARTLTVTVHDDSAPLGDREVALDLDLLVDGNATPALRVPVALLDNDRSGRVTQRLHGGGAIRQPIQGALAHGVPFDLVLDRDDDYRHDRPVGPEVINDLVVNQVRVFGNASTLQVEADAPPLFVGAGGRLQLDRLTLRGPPSPATLPDPRYAEVDGELALQRLRIEGFDGTQSTVAGGTGRVVIDRSMLTGNAPADGLVTSAGGFAVDSSSVILNGPSQHLLGGPADSAIRWSTLFDNRGNDFLFGGSDAPTEFAGNLIQLNDPDSGAATCGAVTSAGFNLFDGTDCALQAATDRNGLTLYPTIGTPPPVPAPTMAERPVAPIDAAIDSGDGCPAVDQLGTPRPQSADGIAAARCDIGAVELGVNPYRGLWIPDRPGHGIDIQTAGNRLFLLWYTYGDDGQPTAYQAQAPLTGRSWQATLKQARRDPQGIITLTDVGTIGLDFEDNQQAQLNWRFDARGVTGREGLRAYLFADGEPRVETTGTWYPPAESGYGMSVVRRGEVTAAVLYYYDAAGEQRWVLGSGNAADVVDIPMQSYTGFCPDCDAAAQPVQLVPAGTVRLHFLTPDRARVDTDVVYPGAAGGSWQRSNVDLVPLNDPVDNRHSLQDHFLPPAASRR